MKVTKNITLVLSIIMLVSMLSGCLCKKSCSIKKEPITQEIEEVSDTKIAKF